MPMLIPLRKAIPVHKVVDPIDAFSTPAFAIVGMQTALAAHASYAGVLLIGVVIGVGGRVLRDILLGQPVQLLQPGQFSSLLVLVGCVAYILLTQWQHFDSTRIGLLTIVLFFVTAHNSLQLANAGGAARRSKDERIPRARLRGRFPS